MDVKALAVTPQVPLHVLMSQEAVQLGVKGEIREHHDLFGQVRPLKKHAIKISLTQKNSLQL